MEPEDSTQPSEPPVEAAADVAETLSTATPSRRTSYGQWAGITASWTLFAIAIGAWVVAWLVHFSGVTPFKDEDFATQSFMIGSAAFLLLALIKVPQWQILNLPGTDLERFDAENEARKTLAQIIGGVGLVAGLYLTTLQLRETQLVATHNEALTRDGQITDRYIKAVQQLGSSDPQSLSVRIGAIFALERIARESKADYWPIMELLSAYVRNRSGSHLSVSQLDALTKFNESMPFAGGSELGQAVMPKTEHSYVVLRERDLPARHTFAESWPDEPVPEDVQAAMTVLGRRRVEFEDEGWHRLDLRFVNLRGLGLESAHLEGADLEGANLQDTNLSEACLCGTQLRQTLMDSTKLDRADLRRADLTGAILLNVATAGADAREAIVLGFVAPENETNKKDLPFEQENSQGAVIDEGTVPLSGTVGSDRLESSELAQFPAANGLSPCLPRSAPEWLRNRTNAPK
jgi:hypothetical protein